MSTSRKNTRLVWNGGKADSAHTLLRRLLRAVWTRRKTNRSKEKIDIEELMVGFSKHFRDLEGYDTPHSYHTLTCPTPPKKTRQTFPFWVKYGFFCILGELEKLLLTSYAKLLRWICLRSSAGVKTTQKQTTAQRLSCRGRNIDKCLSYQQSTWCLNQFLYTDRTKSSPTAICCTSLLSNHWNKCTPLTVLEPKWLPCPQNLPSYKFTWHQIHQT